MIGSRYQGRGFRADGWCRVFIICFLTIVLPAGLYAEVTAQADVEVTRAYVGRSFVLSVYIDGSDRVEEPDIGDVDGAKIESLGGRSRNMESVTSINGRVERVVRKGYVYSYSVTPTEAGVLVIPALEIISEDGTAQTREVRVRVSGPERAEDFRLSIELSDNRVYAGEEVVMTVTWYFAKSVRSPSFRIPMLDSDDFVILGSADEKHPSLEYYSVPVNGSAIEAYRGNERIKDGEFAFLRFSLRLLAQDPGTYRLADSTCAFEGVSGYRQTTDFWGNRGSQEIYAPFVIPAEGESVTCLALPERGKPAEFTGIVGRITAAAEVETDTAHVGDPIPLRLTVSGASGDSVTLPSLSPFFRDDFRIDDKAERGPTAAVESSGDALFELTVRPTGESVTRIPPVEIPYFDPEEERYRFAVTDPLPFTVRPTTVVTAADLEGPAGASVNSSGAEPRVGSGGILYNYGPEDVLTGASASRIGGVSRSVFLLVLLIPPLAWLSVQAVFWIPLLMEHPETRRLLAYRRLRSSLRQLSSEMSDTTEDAGAVADRRREYARRCMQAYRIYLRERYGIPISLSPSRVVSALRDSDDSHDGRERRVDSIRRLLDRLEKMAFAPGDPHPDETADKAAGGRFQEGEDPAALILSTVKDGKPGRAGRNMAAFRITSMVMGVLLFGIVGCADVTRDSSRGSLAAGDLTVGDEVQELLVSADRTFHRANRLAAEGSQDATKTYSEAAALYRRISKEFGIENGPLLYNIGNAYYLAGEPGYAILYYLRARRYAPGDRNLEENLRTVRDERGIPFEESQARRVLDIVLFWHYDLPLRVKTFAMIVMAACFWVGLILFQFLKFSSIRKVAAAALVVCLVLGTSVAADLISRRIPRGVVVIDETECRRGDSLSYAPAFELPLPAGTEFRIVERRPGWLRVRIPAAGGECWLPSWTAEPVRPEE